MELTTTVDGEVVARGILTIVPVSDKYAAIGLDADAFAVEIVDRVELSNIIPSVLISVELELAIRSISEANQSEQ